MNQACRNTAGLSIEEERRVVKWREESSRGEKGKERRGAIQGLEEEHIRDCCR